MPKPIDPKLIKSGMDAMTPADRAHVTMMAAMKFPKSIEKMSKDRDGKPKKRG